MVILNLNVILINEISAGKPRNVLDGSMQPGWPDAFGKEGKWPFVKL